MEAVLETISWAQFEAVELRVGTVVKAALNDKARKPALKVWVDFGAEFGILQTSAQITAHYMPEMLVGKRVVGCLNLGSRNIAGFESQFLLTGFPDENGAVVLIGPDLAVPDGGKLF
jgi:tRNA-binding protein